VTRVKPTPHISGVLVEDAEARVVAWSGKTFPVTAADGPRAAAGIIRSRIYRVLYVSTPIGDPQAPIGSVVVFSPFDINYPLHDRLSGTADFEGEMTRRLGLREIGISSPSEAFWAAEDPTALASNVVNAEGEAFARITVAARPVEADQARLAHLGKRARGLLLAAALLVALVTSLRSTLRQGAPLSRLFLLFGVIVIVRVGLYRVGFPGSLFPGPAFDPAQFSILTTVFTMDLGFLHSPGDLLITGLFALLFVAVAHRRLSGLRPATAPTGPMPVPGLLLLLPATIGVVVIFRMWFDLLHQLTFYSTVEFFSEQTVFPELPAALMLAGLFLLTLCLLPIVSALLITPLRLVAGSNERRRALALLFTAPAWFLGFLSLSHLSPAVSGVLTVALTGTLFLASAWDRLGRGIRIFTLTGAATVLIFPPFMIESWTEVRANVEEEAADMFLHTEEQTFEDRLKADLEMISADPRFVAPLYDLAGDPPPQLAFQIWARSSLSRLAQGCDLSIRDRTGQRELSRFEIDMPPQRLLPGPLTGTSPEELTAWWHWVDLGDRRARYIVCQAPVFTPEGDFTAQLIVSMPAKRDERRPEILRPNGALGIREEGRDLHYAEYDLDRLIRTTNPDYPKVRRALPEVTKKVLTEGLPLLWFREEIGESHWINLYRPRYEDGEITGMMSVGFRSKETRDLLLSFFQLLLVNAAVAIIFTAVRTILPFRRLKPKFQHKLLLSYLVVSAVPVLLLAQVNQTFARESVESQMEETLRRGVRVVRAELTERGVISKLDSVDLRSATPEGLRQVVSDEDMKEIGSRLGLEVNLFLTGAGGTWGAPLVASSEPGLFATELFSDRLPGRAWLETVLLGREFFASPEMAGGYSYLVGTTPLTDEAGRIIGAISLPLIYGQDMVDRELARRNSLILALYLLILLVVVFIGMILARRISSPIERLAQATRRLSAGDLDYRIPRSGKDEFGYLVDSFNQMTEDLKDTRERIVNAEKDAAWREMAKQIAHEIKNPLTPMRLSAQHILRAFRDQNEGFDEILTRGIETIIRQTESLTRIAGEFSAFARLPIRELTKTDVAAVAREVAGLYSGLSEITVIEEIEDTAPVLADREELKRVLLNLAGNAVHAMESGGGTLTIRSGLVRTRFGGEVRELVEVSIRDTGVGIPPEHVEQLFKPNFSTKTGGTGLGLAISKAVIEGIGGHIVVESKPGVGSEFTVRLPVT
jgi:signal transduction histidine kinase